MEEKKEVKSEHHEHHENEHHEAEHRSRKNDWKILSVILAVIIVVLLIFIFYGKGFGGGMSGKAAGEKLVEFLNSRTGGGVAYVSSEDLGNIYNVMVSYQGNNIPVFVTKDGKYFIQGAVPITGANETDTSTQDQTPKEVTKSDKPKVELFVMTHCPYGLQAEKGIIPAIKAIGTKADVKIRFVDYFMHGDKEEQETYNQICIREEQSSKYLNYLSCFTEKGDSAACLTSAGIDKARLNNCLANNATKAKEYYAVDSGLSKEYGVQGSPTLVINGVQADSGRDSASYLKTMCSAFNTAPTAECAKSLSTASPGAGFGTATASTGTASTDASCG